LTATRVTGETVRATLARHKIHWNRAKRWITSPDAVETGASENADAHSRSAGWLRADPAIGIMDIGSDPTE
jgi:hypothetical protein